MVELNKIDNEKIFELYKAMLLGAFANSEVCTIEYDFVFEKAAKAYEVYCEQIAYYCTKKGKPNV